MRAKTALSKVVKVSGKTIAVQEKLFYARSMHFTFVRAILQIYSRLTFQWDLKMHNKCVYICRKMSMHSICLSVIEGLLLLHKQLPSMNKKA